MILGVMPDVLDQILCVDYAGSVHDTLVMHDGSDQDMCVRSDIMHQT